MGEAWLKAARAARSAPRMGLYLFCPCLPIRQNSIRWKTFWEYLRKSKLAITIFNDYDQIVDKSCGSWNFFADDKAAITSITFRDWAQVKP